MAWTKEKLNKFVKEGRGQGEGKDYIPWVKINEFPSKGRATRIYGLKTNRIHHLHSDNQLRAFLLFEWSNRVVDIREGYPLLDLLEVIDEKDDIRLDKFVDKESGEQYVITTNFLLTLENLDGSIEYVARAIRNVSDLNKKLTIEKLEIERRYWSSKGIDWKVITNKELNRQFCKNIEWVRETLIEGSNNLTNIDELGEELRGYLDNNPEAPLKDLLKQYEIINGLDKGIGFYIFRYLIGSKKIQVEMRNEIDINKNMEELSMDFYQDYREEI